MHSKDSRREIGEKKSIAQYEIKEGKKGAKIT